MSSHKVSLKLLYSYTYKARIISLALCFSQEIRHKSLVWNGTRGLISQSMEDVESSLQFVVHVEDRGNVAASVAVVRGGPNSHEVLVSEPVLEAVHNQLMCSGDERNVIDVVEFSGDLRSEKPTSSSWRHGPSLNIFRIRPHKIAEWTFVWDLHSSVNESDLVNSFDFWGQSSMDAEDFSLDDGSNSEVVEHLGAVFPWIGIAVLSDCLIIESVHGGDLPSFVVTSQKGDVSWVLQL
jgi:hypothetical protein